MAETGQIQPLVRRILDLLFVVGLVALLAAGWLPTDGGAVPRVVGPVATAAVLCWLVLRSNDHVVVLVAFWLVAYVALLIQVPQLMGVAILIVLIRHGVRVGVRSALIALVAIELGWLVMDHLDPSRYWVDTVFPMVSTIGHLAVPVVLGVALDRLQSSVQELAAANAEVTEANHALAEQSLLEQDLLLTEERSRAARELHDSLGHQLSAVIVSIDHAQQVAHSQPDRAVAEFAAARAALGAALGDVRAWVRAMHPAHRSSEVGLAGLDNLAASFRGTGLAVEVRVPTHKPVLGRRQDLYVSRFVQEGLTNSLRHGRAGRVWVGAEVRGDELVLSLRDDGRGAIGVPAEGSGLRALRERAAELGGTFESSGAAAGGFRIRAALPLGHDVSVESKGV